MLVIEHNKAQLMNSLVQSSNFFHSSLYLDQNNAVYISVHLHSKHQHQITLILISAVTIMYSQLPGISLNNHLC